MGITFRHMLGLFLRGRNAPSRHQLEMVDEVLPKNFQDRISILTPGWRVQEILDLYAFKKGIQQRPQINVEIQKESIGHDKLLRRKHDLETIRQIKERVNEKEQDLTM